MRAVDTLGHLLALHVTPANEQERAQVADVGAAVQEATGQHVELAYVDQGYTEREPTAAAAGAGHPSSRSSSWPTPARLRPVARRWVVERSFAWAARFRRLARDYERLPNRGGAEFPRLHLPHAASVHPYLKSITASTRAKPQ